MKDEDLSDLGVISAAHMIDFIAVPFVACEADVNQVKKTLG